MKTKSENKITPQSLKPRVNIGREARRLGVTRQTLASYLKAGIPLDDEEATREWILKHRLQAELGRFQPRGGQKP